MGNHRRLSILGCGLLMIVIRLSLAPVIPTPPQPIIHDEASYLLQSDTFASGRITNPPHPMGVHFETFHVNQWPTYQSMYLPGKGLFMAAGQMLFGSPWFGMLLAWALAVGATVWMLQGWMPPRWALLGGLFWVARFAVFEQVNMRPNYGDYWNSPEVILGGALVFGAAGRLRKKMTWSASTAMGAGLSLLMITRPLEGFVVSVPVILGVMYWAMRDGRRVPEWSRLLAPAALILGVTAAGLLYYNWKSTGSALTMPYQVNWEQYHITKPFLWQAKRALPHYNHISMRTMYIFWEIPDYLNTRHWDGLREHELKQIQRYYLYWFFPVTPLFVIGGLDLMKRKRKRLLVIATLALLGVLMLMTWPAQPHYLAAGACAVVAVMLFGLREVRTWKIGHRRFGMALSRGLMAAVLALCALRVGLLIADPFGVIEYEGIHVSLQHAVARAEAQKMPGKQLVIVYYRRNYQPMEEWVYNLANVDQQKVIWARNMGAKANEELLRYYSDRQALVVDPMEYPFRFHKYGDVKDQLDQGDALHDLSPVKLAGPAPQRELQALQQEYEAGGAGSDAGPSVAVVAR